MPTHFDNVKDEIRRRADIVDLVGQRVALKKTGKNWKGLCPFHDDRNPSFIVSAEFGSYRCWSCGAKGDVFTFVMETQRVEFPEALKILAKEYGVKLEASQPGASDLRQNIQQAMAVAQSFFVDELKRSPNAKEYLTGRKIDESVIQEWGIGYAPDIGEALAVRLKKAGLSLSECAQAFLVKQDASGGYMDQFRGRITFPIHDERGKLVAFGGRILGDGIPKYINSSDTPVYNKSRLLYGMHLAKEQIAKEEFAVLVEGYLDVIACHRAGIKNTVASLGTALTDEQIKLLSRWCPKVVVLYDSDTAGIKAAERAAELIQSHKLTVRIACIPEDSDPDTLLTKGGPAALLKVVQESVSLLEFRLAQMNKRLKPNDEEYWAEVTKVLASYENPLELQKHLLPIAAQYPGISDRLAAQRALEKMVDAERKRNRASSRSGKSHESDEPKSVKIPIPTKSVSPPTALVLAAFLDPKIRPKAHQAILDSDSWADGLDLEIAHAIRETYPDSPPEGSPKDWLFSLPNDAAIQVIQQIGLENQEPITDEVLTEAIERLKRIRASQDARKSVSDGFEDDALRAYNERLRSIKGNI
ncbi:DNA primase [Kamptonema cortianum]|nr:DNA primase [Kamptonema cortianum]